MRITIDFSRVNHGVPKIRMKRQSSSNDDLRMQNLGLAVYEEIAGTLSTICNKMNGKQVVFSNEGEVQ